ncbi:hypothetical protein BKA67DRAFT_533532 [Truncatella angustata]|uniref:Wings apart-like protein C-terminal domain-containing protein n=1 Tax=Truncatella angustata TaxID=152316 RepID=A0A9P8UU34_9PEZI|nr:uncharacterized protein BKA67DRAFT_533532 [Truncatella angustata]KAH6658378.1 hypothetical protein BKA67DRAFT_533532 [Truncatella angustata]
MASLSAQPKSTSRLKTYGRASKKTVPTQPSQRPVKNIRAGISRSVSDLPATRHVEHDPYDIPSDDSSPDHPTLNTRTGPPITKPLTNAERKRKVNSVYPADDHGLDPVSEDSSPSALKPKQRSRVSSPTEDAGGSRPKTYGPTRQARAASADIMEVDAANGLLSSPPPTPVAPLDRSKGKEGSNSELPFSPNTMNMFGSLQVGDKASQQHQIPVRPKFKPSATAPNVSRNASKSSRQVSISAPASKPAEKRRKRLIDALVEQMEESDGTVDEDKTDSQVTWADPVVSSGQNSEDADSQSSSQASKTRRAYGGQGPRTLARSGSSLKHTYGTSKVTLLEEDNIFEALAMPDLTTSTAPRRLELTPKVLPKADLDADEDSSVSTPRKIRPRDIHELRQAGANSRVADEMFDLSTQIGQPTAKPSSSRRTALLQIAEKARHKDYRKRMRDHGLDAMVLKSVGDEADPISGYLITVILLQILTSSAAPHVIQLLQDEEAGNLFGRLLQLDEDIKKLVRDRKSNLSKRNQGLLIAGQAALLDLPIWQSAKPMSTSPRTVTLKCLEMLIAQDAQLGSDDALFPPAVTKGLFDTVSAAQGGEFWDQPAAETFDVHCALSVLEHHAVKAMEAQSSEKLAKQYLPSVADAFGVALKDPTRHNALESPLLKLVLNMTNSSITAPGIFVGKGLILPLSISICTSFTQSLSAVSDGDEWSGLIDGLVLRLGILINFAEQGTAVREAVYESRGSGGESPIKELIRLFLANHRNTAEADSEAKSQLNVAFGYLSLLLGYLCLYPPTRKAFTSSHSAKSLGPLLDSIHEFISHHRAMEASLLDAGVDDPRAHGGYTERLQGLVDQLEADAAHD